MNIMFFLIAALMIPSFDSSDDAEVDAGATPDPDATPDPTPDPNPDAGPDTDPTTTAGWSTATGPTGAPVIQGDASNNILGPTSIMDFVTADTTLATLPLNTIGVDGGEGDDIINMTDTDVAYVDGGAGNDLLTGSGFQASGPALINGGDGDDTINIGEAEAYGGAGDDSISGGGNGWFAGGTSTALFGDEGNDTIELTEDGRASGGAGDDTITAGGLSTITGGAGDDSLTVRDNDGFYETILSSADGGAGDDSLAFEYDNQTYFGGSSDPSLDTDVALTGGAGADSFTVTGVFEAVPVSDTSGSALFATITDFDPSEDTLLIELSGETLADGASGVSGFTSNLDVDLVSTVSDPEIGTFDINFTLSGQNAAGETLSRAMTIRIEELGNIEFDFLTITETPNGVAVSIDQTAAA